MRVPEVCGLIPRRILVNFRVDPDVMRSFLQAPFRPKLHGRQAIAGICLIRLEQIRPRWLPRVCGISSENAAHRIAVLWDEPTGATKEGVYIPRRDTGSVLNWALGGRLFPGEHHFARFDVIDNGRRVSMVIQARDDDMHVELRGEQARALPATSCFASLEEASNFFEPGSVGYSATRDGRRLDGLRLQTDGWQVDPLTVHHVVSSFFDNSAVFPPGSIAFDHALIMRNLSHRWHQVEDMQIEESAIG